MTTYFKGLGFVQLLFLMLYRSGLWGPLLRSMYIKRNKLLKFQFLLGSLKKQLGSSVSYYQVGGKDFWADSEAWKLACKALPSSNWVKMAKFDDFLTKIAEFFAIFGKMALQNFFPDPGGLLERFSSIPTGLTLFKKIFAFKIENFGI